jgi:hypothetical protein
VWRPCRLSPASYLRFQGPFAAVLVRETFKEPPGEGAYLCVHKVEVEGPERGLVARQRMPVPPDPLDRTLQPRKVAHAPLRDLWTQSIHRSRRIHTPDVKRVSCLTSVRICRCCARLGPRRLALRPPAPHNQTRPLFDHARSPTVKALAWIRSSPEPAFTPEAQRSYQAKPGTPLHCTPSATRTVPCDSCPPGAGPGAPPCAAPDISSRCARFVDPVVKCFRCVGERLGLALARNDSLDAQWAISWRSTQGNTHHLALVVCRTTSPLLIVIVPNSRCCSKSDTVRHLPPSSAASPADAPMESRLGTGGLCLRSTASQSRRAGARATVAPGRARAGVLTPAPRLRDPPE